MFEDVSDYEYNSNEEEEGGAESGGCRKPLRDKQNTVIYDGGDENLASQYDPEPSQKERLTDEENSSEPGRMDVDDTLTDVRHRLESTKEGNDKDNKAYVT